MLSILQQFARTTPAAEGESCAKKFVTLPPAFLRVTGEEPGILLRTERMRDEHAKREYAT
jgi:hypothetical protein